MIQVVPAGPALPWGSIVRTPFFVLALVLILVAVLLEMGSLGILRGVVPEAALSGGGAAKGCASMVPPRGVIPSLDDADIGGECANMGPEQLAEMQALLARDKPPGRAIPAMALVDGILLFSVALMGSSLLIRERLQGRLQGCVTLIFSLLLLIGAIVLIITTLLLVVVMISLLLAAPFGTLAYLAIYGFFNRGGASAALALLMTLKLGFGVCLVLAHQRFLQNRGLVLMLLTSLLGNVIVAFLHGLVPTFLVSITDGIAAIVVAILAAIWAIVLLVGSVLAVVRALRFDRA